MPVPMQQKKKLAGIAIVNCIKKDNTPSIKVSHVQFVNIAESMYSENG